MEIKRIVKESYEQLWASQVVLAVKNLPANVGDISDAGLISGSGRSSGGGNGSPLQYSSLDKSMERGAWQATVPRVLESQTRLKQLSMHTHPLDFTLQSIWV